MALSRIPEWKGKTVLRWNEFYPCCNIQSESSLDVLMRKGKSIRLYKFNLKERVRAKD